MTEMDLAGFNKEVQDLNTLYTNSPRSDMLRLLLTGDTGSGKTYALRTAPCPVHIDSFDPGGTQTVDDLIASGRIIADTRFEFDDPKDPRAFNTFEASLDRRIRVGYFSHIGTYALDSLTNLASAAMALVLKEKGRPGGIPQQDDYLPQMVKIERVIRKITSLPCHVVVNSHLDMKEDVGIGQLVFRLMITGKLAVRLPMLFSEIYVTQAKETTKGTRYAFLTCSTGRFVARTRIGRGGLFEKYEEPDIRQLLKKANKPFEDKDRREQENEQESSNQ